MFRASSAHPQEVNDVNCTCMQPLVFSFSAGGCLVHSQDLHCKTSKTDIPLHIDLLKMSG